MTTSPRYINGSKARAALSATRDARTCGARSERLPPEGAGAFGDSSITPGSAAFSSFTCPSRSKLDSDRSGHSSIRSLAARGESLVPPDVTLLCDECVSRVVALRQEALQVIRDRHVSTSDPKLAVLLYEGMQVPAWIGLGGCCEVCLAHLSQLKQEAIHSILTQNRTIWPNSPPANVSAGHPASGTHTLPKTLGSSSPNLNNRRRSSNLRTESWVREQARLEALWTANNGVSTFDDTVSQDLSDMKEDDKSTVLCNFSGPLPFNTSKVSAMLPAGFSFIVRAVQKLNLTSRRRKQGSDNGSSRYPTNFSRLLQKAPPSVPLNLLHTPKAKELLDAGKVKVVLRVGPFLMAGLSQFHALKLDAQKKQVIVLEPSNQNAQRSAAAPTFIPKTFNFDATFGPEAPQAKVCEKSLFEVLHTVMAGADGCVLSFGQSKEGTSYTMIGSDESTSDLGIIPCAISWLFKLINKKKDKTWANISVSVSAVEVCGESEIIKDLLSDVEAGDLPYKTDVFLQEDPVCGIQLCNNKMVSAPTAERAAFLLDAALASRSTGKEGCRGTSHHQCHMFYTLHVCQKHIESNPTSGMYVDQSKLSLIDLGNCTSEKSKNNAMVCLVDLGSVIMAKLNGHKHEPNKGSKLSMLMQESLGNVNCRTAIIAHVSTLYEDLPETLCTIQIVSRIRRLQKIRKQGCSSPGGRSLGKEKNVNNLNTLRAFHSVGSLDQHFSLRGLTDDLEERSGTDKSCDTVICMDPKGFPLYEEVKENQEFVPIIPSLQSASFIKQSSLLKSTFQNSNSPKKEIKKLCSRQNSTQSSSPDVEHLKCSTFAELQNRLGSIDESDLVDLYPSKMQPANSLIKFQTLARKAVKIAAEQPEIQQSPSKKHRELGQSIQRDAPMKAMVENPCRQTGQVKNTQKSLPCSPRRDNVSDLLQCVQATESLNLTRKGNIASSLLLPKKDLSSNSSTLPSKIRISPLGTSLSSLSATLGSQVSFPITRCEVIPQFPLENHAEKATITVTVNQPLDLNGQDELIYSVVKEVAVRGTVNEGKASDMTSTGDHHSTKNVPSGSQSVKIIGSVGAEQSAVNFEAPVKDKISKTLSAYKAIPLAQTLAVKPQADNTSQLDSKPKECQTKVGPEEDQTAFGDLCQNEASQIKKFASEITLECNDNIKKCNQDNRSSREDLKDSVSSIRQKISQDLQIKLPENPGSTSSTHNNKTLTRSWHSVDIHDHLKDSQQHSTGWEIRNTNSQKAMLENAQHPTKQGSVEWTLQSEPLSRSGKDSPSKKNRKDVQPFLSQTSSDSQHHKTNKKCLIEESSKLFSAKLEQLTNRSKSLGKSYFQCLDAQSDTVFSSKRMEGSGTSPRVSRRHRDQDYNMNFGSKGSLDKEYTSPPAKSVTSPALKAVFEEEGAVTWNSHTLRRVPRFSPNHDEINTAQTSKSCQSYMATVNKLLLSPVIRKMSPNLCVSPKSSRHAINRSSSLSPDEFSKKIIWSSPSLSRKQGKSSPAFKYPNNRVLNGRIDILKASGDSLSSSSQDSLDIDDLEESKRKIKLLSQTLPSPYNRVTAPRKPKHCSGHASDTTSVLSGDLPPAMCKTALLYNRISTISSGYESLMRDSETTHSSMSIHETTSDQSCFSTMKSAKGSKKRNIGSLQRRPSQDTILSLRRSSSGSKLRWIDRGTSDSYEIKVYEIDNVDSLQRRGKAGNKSVVCFSAKLKFLEHRQQRIAEVRAKYNALKRELELAKQHLMVDPGKWTREFDLWQTFEVDSLEHLEALEMVTQRLENQVNRCKANVMMVTSFDALPKRRQTPRRGWPPTDYKGLIEI
ncbi:kinesin-like protein KIF26B [Trichomycterus rosablanca]|uniref:kinesin-like protein KIF26B n=1 Tax=Trichomycterus rosablanca TaxID=2290929 RepID=UPI002F35F66D